MLSDKFINRVLQLFIRFLKEEEIIEVFKKNYLMYLKHYNKERYLKYNSSYNSYLLDMAHRKDYIEEESIYHLFLDHAMEWRKTEKGHNFWCKVNRKWKEYFFNNLRLIKKRNKWEVKEISRNSIIDSWIGYYEKNIKNKKYFPLQNKKLYICTKTKIWQ